jgi:hypothetical protein
MPTTMEIFDTSYPAVNSPPQPAATLIVGTNYDGCCNVSGTLEFAVDDALLAANPINRVDPEGTNTLVIAFGGLFEVLPIV